LSKSEFENYNRPACSMMNCSVNHIISFLSVKCFSLINFHVIFAFMGMSHLGNLQTNGWIDQ